MGPDQCPRPGPQVVYSGSDEDSTGWNISHMNATSVWWPSCVKMKMTGSSGAFIDNFQQPSDYSGLKKQGLSFTFHLIVTRPLFVPRRRRFNHVSGGNLRRFLSDHKSSAVVPLTTSTASQNTKVESLQFTNATTADEPVPRLTWLAVTMSAPHHGSEHYCTFYSC